MYLGHMVEMGTTEQVFQPPYHPYTEILISVVQIADASIQKKQIVLEGDVPLAMGPRSGCPFQTRRGWKAEVSNELCYSQVPLVQQLQDGHQIEYHLANDILTRVEPVIRIATK